MQATLERDALGKAISIAQRAVSTRGVMAVLSNLKFDATTDAVTVSATNLDVSIVAKAKAHVMLDGSRLVPAKTLSDFLATIPGGAQCDLASNGDAGTKIAAAKGSQSFKANFNGADVAEMPEIPSTVPGDGSIKISSVDLRLASDQVAICAAKDESRPVLAGVNLRADGKTLKFGAADGFRLGLRSTEMLEDIHAPMSIILPAKALAEVARLADGDVRLGISANNSQATFAFSSGDTEVIFSSRLLEGTFPDLERVVPNGDPIARLIMSRQELLTATKAAAVFARDAADAVKLEVDNNGAVTLSGASQGSGDTVVTVPCEDKNGDAVAVTFSSAFFGEVLGGLRGDTVRVSIHGPLSPLVIDVPSDEASVHVIMPMQGTR